jgi:hypothetical protein
MTRKITIITTLEILLEVRSDHVDTIKEELEQAIYEGNEPVSLLRDKWGYKTGGITHIEATVISEQVCRCCGCTNDAACIQNEDETCEWAEDDLCSFCIGKENEPEQPLPW